MQNLKDPKTGIMFERKLTNDADLKSYGLATVGANMSDSDSCKTRFALAGLGI